MPTVLIIEDDPDISESLRDLLELSDYKVYSTMKADKTEDMIAKHIPDIILLDKLLSGKDGAVICKALKADAKTYHIPIIMMSAHPTAKKESQLAGANDFLAKPFDGDELLSIIKRYTS